MSRSESDLAGRDRWDVEPVVSVHVIFPAFEIEGGSVEFLVTDAVTETEHSPSSVQTPAEPELNYERLQAGNYRNPPPGVSFSVHHLAVHRWPLNSAISMPDHEGITIAIPVNYLLPASVRNGAYPSSNSGTVTTRRGCR